MIVVPSDVVLCRDWLDSGLYIDMIGAGRLAAGWTWLGLGRIHGNGPFEIKAVFRHCNRISIGRRIVNAFPLSSGFGQGTAGEGSSSQSLLDAEVRFLHHLVLLQGRGGVRPDNFARLHGLDAIPEGPREAG